MAIHFIDTKKTHISAGNFAQKTLILFSITFTALIILTPNILLVTSNKSLLEIYSKSCPIDIYIYIAILFCFFIIPVVFECNKRISSISKSFSFLYGIIIPIFLLYPIYSILIKDINLSTFVFTGVNGDYGRGFYAAIIVYLINYIYLIKILFSDDEKNHKHLMKALLFCILLMFLMLAYIEINIGVICFFLICILTALSHFILKEIATNTNLEEDK